jgi:hypothetical protein
LIKKVLFSAAVAVGTAVGAAIPAGADPSAFGTLSCGCEPTASDGRAAATELIDQGIQSGLAYLQGRPATSNSAPLRGAMRDRSTR